MEKISLSSFARRRLAKNATPADVGGAEFGDTLSQPALWSPGPETPAETMAGSALEGGFLRIAVWATALVPLTLLIWLTIRFYREVP